MRTESSITPIRPGTQVQAADGQPIGTVREVWIGSDARHSSARCDEIMEQSRFEIAQNINSGLWAIIEHKTGYSRVAGMYLWRWSARLRLWRMQRQHARTAQRIAANQAKHHQE
jgi:hypothetical protein